MSSRPLRTTRSRALTSLYYSPHRATLWSVHQDMHTWPVKSLHVYTEGLSVQEAGVNQRPEAGALGKGAQARSGDRPGSGRRYHSGRMSRGGVICKKEESHEHGLGEGFQPAAPGHLVAGRPCQSLMCPERPGVGGWPCPLGTRWADGMHPLPHSSPGPEPCWVQAG